MVDKNHKAFINCLITSFLRTYLYLGVDKTIATYEDEELFIEWIYAWNKQLKYQFQRTIISKKQCKVSLSLGLHSLNEEHALINQDAIEMNRTNARRFSCFH